MPELPEVEVTIKELKPKLVGRSITRIDVRNPRLRFPIPSEIQEIAGAPSTSICALTMARPWCTSA
jgi:formamidopyrimidine-DNA glycosylase